MRKAIKPKKEKYFMYFDDCPVCQLMKREGIKLKWHPDKVERKTRKIK